MAAPSRTPAPVSARPRESHAQAQFSGALRDGGRHDTVKADAGKQQRQTSEQGDQSYGNELLGRRSINLLLQRDHLV